MAQWRGDALHPISDESAGLEDARQSEGDVHTMSKALELAEIVAIEVNHAGPAWSRWLYFMVVITKLPGRRPLSRQTTDGCEMNTGCAPPKNKSGTSQVSTELMCCSNISALCITAVIIANDAGGPGKPRLLWSIRAIYAVCRRQLYMYVPCCL